MADARYYDTKENPEFTPQGKRIMWRAHGDQHWSRLYTPSADALRWDGVPWATDAIGVRSLCPNDAAFAYVGLRITGRKVRLIPGTGGYDGAHGIKAKMTFAKNTEYEATVDAWVVE